MPWYGSHAYLNEYIRLNNCQRILEIGVYTGENAVSMVEAAIEHAPDPREVEYYGFDLFLNASSDQVGRKLEGLGCTFALFEGNTLKTLPTSVVIASPPVVAGSPLVMASIDPRSPGGRNRTARRQCCRPITCRQRRSGSR